MTVSATLLGTLLHGVAASRPAANAVAGGTIYSATDTGAITQSDGSTWSTYATISSGMTNPMSAVGDMIQGTTAGAPVVLAAPLAGKVLTGAGVTTPLVFAYPPGYQFDYAEGGAITVTGTAEGSSTAVVTGNAVTYDGSTAVVVEFYSPDVYINSATIGHAAFLALYDGGTSLGLIALPAATAVSQTFRCPVFAGRKLTPSAGAHTYSIGAWKNASGDTAGVNSGAGGAGTTMPSFIRIRKI